MKNGQADCVRDPRTVSTLQRGLAAEACSLEPPDLGRALKAMRGEVLGSRALAFACVGRLDEALPSPNRADVATHGIEANPCDSRSQPVGVERGLQTWSVGDETPRPRIRVGRDRPSRLYLSR